MRLTVVLKSGYYIHGEMTVTEIKRLNIQWRDLRAGLRTPVTIPGVDGYRHAVLLEEVAALSAQTEEPDGTRN